MPDLTNLKQDLSALWKRFETWEIPVHSLLVSHGDEPLWETYHPPYQSDKLHRMFSITKSYCALAIGCLAAEQKLDLDDPIIRFFPEYLPSADTIHPFLAEMKIRHLLMMQTCHSSTTYKLNPEQDWVESFFTTPPTHKSGQIFLYDTSASHTLAALVKKLTGQGVLEYLRPHFLDQIGFSQDAYIILDPFGVEMGGSGLMAYPRDLMVTAQYLMKQITHGTDAFSDYLREAVCLSCPTLHSGQTLDEQQGYGYQFWRIRNGFAMYGMGGQYVLFYPDPGLILTITADAQNIKGGTQKILDAVHEVVSPYCKDTGKTSYDCAAKILTASTVNYQLLPNKGEFTEISITMDTYGGCLSLKHPEAAYQIPFGWGNTLQTSVIAKYNQPIATSGTWLDEQSLMIYTQLVGECVGSITFLIRFRPDGLTLWMNKIEETLFTEFSDFAESLPVS